MKASSPSDLDGTEVARGCRPTRWRTGRSGDSSMRLRVLDWVGDWSGNAAGEGRRGLRLPFKVGRWAWRRSHDAGTWARAAR
jgi:hypothetical protein